MEELNLEQRKKISLDLLLAFDSFCQTNGIKYSIAYGTLLGAVRHKGFIPWDDDIDVLLPRSDYERFLTLFRDSETACLHRPLEHGYFYPFAKLSDPRTTGFEDGRKGKIGVNIDIFPADLLTIDKKDRRAFKSVSWKILYIGMTRPPFIKYKKGKRWIFLRHLKTLFRFLVSRLFALSALYKKEKKLINKCQGQYMANIVWAPINRYDSLLPNLFSSLSTIFFEGYKFTCFSDTDLFLKGTYGNYMELPPVEQRVSDHSLHVFWKQRSEKLYY